MSVPGFACGSLIASQKAGSYAYRTTIATATDATIYSGGIWDGVAIGTPAPDRYVILGIGTSAATRTVNSVSIGGVTASRVTNGSTAAQQQSSTATVEIWIALVPDGTTANISITFSGATNRCIASVWTAELAAATAVDVDKSNAASGANVTLTTASHGVVVCFHHHVIGTPGNYSWSNVTERYDAVTEPSASSSADAATTGANVTPTVSWTSAADTRRALVCASFRLRSGVVTAPVPRILDGYSNVTGAWSISRQLLQSFGGGARYTTDVGVNQLNDQTGNGRHLAITLGNQQPLLQSGTLGPQNRTGARFDGSDDAFTSNPTNLDDYISASTGYIVACAIIRAVDTNSGTHENNDSVFDGSTTSPLGFYFKNDAGSYSWAAYNMVFGSLYNSVSASISSPIYQVVVCEWRHEGGNLYGRFTAQGGTPGAWQSTASGDTINISTETFNIASSASNTQLDLLEVATMSSAQNDTLRDALVTNMLAHYG